MAQVIRGFRDKKEDDWNPKSPELQAINKLLTSDDGWICPHCGNKEYFSEQEWKDHQWIQLMNMDDPIEGTCGSCGKTFFVRAFVVTTFSSCASESFEEEEKQAEPV